MAANATNTYFDDGGLPYDGQLVTIGTKTFIFEDFSPVEGSHFVQSNDVNGAPRGGRDIADLITCSATAQYPSGATMADTPARFTVVSLQHRGAAKQFVITEVGIPQKTATEIKVSLKLRELLNSASGTGANAGNAAN